MLICEFVNRTGYTPTQEEWEVINDDYMNSELHKDAFCDLWRHLYAHKVKAQRDETRRRSHEEAQREKTVARVRRWVRSRRADELERVERWDVEEILKDLDFDISRAEVRKMYKYCALFACLSDREVQNYWKLHSAVCYGY